MATSNRIADPTIRQPREFLTDTESNYRSIRAPKVACLQINPAAPDSSLLAVSLARVDAVNGTLGVLLESADDRTQEEQYAIEGVICSAQELRLLLTELQDRDSARQTSDRMGLSVADAISDALADDADGTGTGLAPETRERLQAALVTARRLEAA